MLTRMALFRLITRALLLLYIALPAAARAGAGADGVKETVSFHTQIWPIIQARCAGCHQPAAPGGKLILTGYASLLKGGEHGPTLTKKRPDASPLMDYLTGKRELMPKGGPTLASAEIELFRKWIAQGAADDTPVVKDPIDANHPPVYTAPPVITALAYAPDGHTLAVSGYREILLQRADGSGLTARLIGQAQKILSLAYSSDGKLLAAAGGSPAQFGEIQFWDTATNKPVNSVQITGDTLFGGSFSPDGKQFGFGCADNSVRVITVPDGRQVMRLDNHSDWVFATTFSMDGKNILSVSRDQAIKLTLIEGASFIDDINTHYTPLRCLVRNPKADQVLCVGDDGIPRLYKIFRTEARTMNQEDHNLIRAYDRQNGVGTALAFSPDGTLFAVGAETGLVNLYRVADGGHVATLSGQKGVIYALAFHPDGKQVVAAGFDGLVRLYEVPTGRLLKAFAPVPLATHAPPKHSPPAALSTRK
jgi:mono/diheme cytochrome c family protein